MAHTTRRTSCARASMCSSSKRERHGGGKTAMPSIIGAGLQIVGDLKCDGEVQIEGSFEGDVKCHTLVVGADASVVGSVECDSVRICGKINGRISAPAVELASTAHVVGDILHERITIETGAYFEGSLKHLNASAGQVQILSSSAEAPSRSTNDGRRSGTAKAATALDRSLNEPCEHTRSPSSSWRLPPTRPHRRHPHRHSRPKERPRSSCPRREWPR